MKKTRAVAMILSLTLMAELLGAACPVWAEPAGAESALSGTASEEGYAMSGTEDLSDGASEIPAPIEATDEAGRDPASAADASTADDPADSAGALDVYNGDGLSNLTDTQADAADSPVVANADPTDNADVDPAASDVDPAAGDTLEEESGEEAALMEADDISIGAGIAYTLENGVLTITGSGATTDFSYYDSPFYNDETIEKIIIGDGITYVGSYLFNTQRDSIKYVEFGKDVASVGYQSFRNVRPEIIIFRGGAPDNLKNEGGYWGDSTIFYPEGGAGWAETIENSTNTNYRPKEWIPYTDLEAALTDFYTAVPGGLKDGVSSVSPRFLKGFQSILQLYPSETRDGIYIYNSNRLYFVRSSDGYAEEILRVKTQSSKVFLDGGIFYYLDGDSLCAYDLDGVREAARVPLNGLQSIDAIAGDGNGRFFVANHTSGDETVYTIHLYNGTGKELSSCQVPGQVYNFNAFDQASGHFFFEMYYNWVYWGYDHDGHGLAAGTVSGNKISYTETTGEIPAGMLTYPIDCLAYICQNWYHCHYQGAELIGGQLVVVSNLLNTVSLHDPATFECRRTFLKPNDITSDYSDDSSIGTRTVDLPAHKTMIIYDDSEELVEYVPQTGEKLASYKTAHPVFMLKRIGTKLVILEKEEGTYYFELIDWRDPTQLTVSGPDTMQVGETGQLDYSSDSNCSFEVTWTSSDNNILTVTEEGRIAAWRPGTAVITASSKYGNVSGTLTVTVTEGDIQTPEKTTIPAEGSVTNNIHKNNYATYANVVRSYLTECGDGTLMRVEAVAKTTDSKEVLVEYLKKDGTLISSKKITPELPLIGGFFAGEDAYYLAFGQTNYEESDETEVLRVVKYDKNWKKLGSASVKGANTYIPFDAGSLRMDEAAGTLYVYTCHEMYKSDDGLHHQANMIYVIKEVDMTVADQYYEVMNVAQAGYVSHSFNQFIKTDGEYVYRADHGDAGPRGVPVIRSRIGESITDVSYRMAANFPGKIGVNNTGASLGGFELGSDNCLTAVSAASVEADDTALSANRNVWLLITDKALTWTKKVPLTSLSKTDGWTTRTPQLVKLTNGHFLVMWEEVKQGDATFTKAVTVNEEGTRTSDTVTLDMPLSDCQPITCSDGLVRWYVTDGNKMTLYVLNPYDLKPVTPEAPKPSRKYIELAGANRYATACELAKESFGKTPDKAPQEIILVTGEDFADALSANGYAGALNGGQGAPVLMTKRAELHKAVKELLTKTWGGRVKKCTIIGGGFAEKVYKDLTSCGIPRSAVTDLAGKNRIGTADAVLKAGFAKGYFTNDRLIVAKGWVPADALSVAPWCYKLKIPMVLTDKTFKLKGETASLVKKYGFKQVILLGDVTDSCACGLKSKRLKGANRWKTSLEIAKYFVDTAGAGTYQKTAFARGEDNYYPDALGAGMLQGRLGAPAILVKENRKSDILPFCAEKLSDAAKADTFYFIGSAAKAKSPAVYSQITGAIESLD